MAAEIHNQIVTALVVFSEASLREGEEYRIATSDFQTAGRLLQIILHASPLHRVSKGITDVEVRSVQLASIKILLPTDITCELMPEGKACQIDFCEKVTGHAIASGFAMACRPLLGCDQEESALDSHGFAIWLTGLSGSGKTTISYALMCILAAQYRVEILDADVVRTHICKGLGYTEADRRENVRRLSIAATMLVETGAIVLISAISPYRTAREAARNMIGRFIEVYVNAPLSVCEKRDVKGLYEKARNGEIKNFTGIDDPYEPPHAADIECHTDQESIGESVAKIMKAIVCDHKQWLASVQLKG